MRSFIDRLVAARIGQTWNFYRDGDGAETRARRVEDYLDARAGAPILLVGEAPGYRGARISGIPFTSERLLTGHGPAEATATMVHAALADLGLADEVLLWNVVPTHPGTATSNRRPTAGEVRAGREFARHLARGRLVLGVGRLAAEALDAPYIRHPSRGGVAAFRKGLLQFAPGRTHGPPLLRMKTYNAKPGEIQRDWYLVDAEGKTLGRLATQIAERLRGKGKPQYTPHVDTGDFVVVVNAEKVVVTGKKLDEKMYYNHSGYPGGLRERTLREQLERRPTEVLRSAVKGMLPRNRLGRAQLTKLKIYAGADHPHEAQAPTKIEV